MSRRPGQPPRWFLPAIVGASAGVGALIALLLAYA